MPSMANVNVGVLGHVDSGKTSLVRALSTQLSTAALDKHPQSQQRGITLDLGFSAFRLPGTDAASPALQVTLVDCPGHASLFRTILGGVAIIDTVLLVVDVRKGLQPQTVESLLLAALAAERRVLVALSKVDLLPDVEPERSESIARVTHEIRAFLTRHFPQFRHQDVVVPVIPVSVGSGVDSTGIPELLDALRSSLHVPQRDATGSFRLAIDHCFAVPGNGTVLTGTVLAGALRVGDELELLPLGTTVKVKTLQVFKHEVTSCAQGDRVGVRVAGLDPALVERAVAVAPPGSLAPVTQVIIPVTQVPFFRGTACKSGKTCHATVGHTTVLATATFFSPLGASKLEEELIFDPSALYEYVPELTWDHDVEAREGGSSKSTVFALLQFERVVFCPPEALVVCSRLELDAKRFPCRLAFYGAVQTVVGSSEEELNLLRGVHDSVMSLADLRVGRVKSRNGVVDKLVTSRDGGLGTGDQVIGRDMFEKDVDWTAYQDATVLFENAQLLGSILGPFGKAGKFRLEVRRPRHQQQTMPEPGDTFVMRFLKLATFKPPKLKENSKTAAKAKAKTRSSAASRALVQDSRLLYPEAFAETEVVGDDVAPVAQPPALEQKMMATATRSGQIERLKGETAADGRNPFAIVSGLFDSEQQAKEAVGRRVRCLVSRPGDQQELSQQDEGEIEKPFGKAGKVRVSFQVGGGTRGQEGDVIELC
ncbi:hypothetical protein BBJ28_00020061 [Nothophytophthora sp. Chile5]|nr:hypothetical protein BBJ28_00020061 [Nothophytophthora sp. Chile5]